MTVTRLTGGLTPGDGGDPRTFPAIWNDTADAIDSLSIGTAVASEGQVLAFSTAVSGYVPEDVFGGAVNGTAVYRFVDTVYFTSDDTFTKADYPWLRAIRVKCQGGGGAGAGAVVTGAGQISGGGGGGGGGYAESFITDIAGLAASVTVTRGAGGSGVSGAGGNNGGNSSFGSLVIGNGGAGGGAQPSPTIPVDAFGTSGLGGAGTGDLVVRGAAGSLFFAQSTNRVFRAQGGTSFLGGNDREDFVNISANGVAGRIHGGGGGNAGNPPSSSAKTGGAGANGIVIVELYA